ncbi:hypothetical protein [Brevibacillus laterosporus]|uniref:hypothetical protein n=1 Tax=Brevibacillus laterosporus TaxID=1465 RepID=UPI003D1C70CD
MINITKPIDKNALAFALYEFAQQKPGFDSNNYSDQAAYQSDYRHYKKYADKNRKMSVESIVNILNELTDNEIIDSFGVNGGRLSFVEHGDSYRIVYVTGQYFPTEYQTVLCNVFERLITYYLVNVSGTSL